MFVALSAFRKNVGTLHTTLKYESIVFHALCEVIFTKHILQNATYGN